MSSACMATWASCAGCCRWRPLRICVLSFAFCVFFQSLPLHFDLASCLPIVLFFLSVCLCLPACFLIFLFFCFFPQCFLQGVFVSFSPACPGKGPRLEHRRRNLFFPCAIRLPFQKFRRHPMETGITHSLTAETFHTEICVFHEVPYFPCLLDL